MTTEELVANYSPIGDMITTIICLVLLFIIIKVLYLSRGRMFVFLKRSLHFILVGSCSNIGFYIAITHYEAPNIVLFVLRDTYHVCFLLSLYCFILYMKKMLDVKGTFINVSTLFTRILFVICLIMDVFSPFTRVGLYYENGFWQDAIISPYNFFYLYSLLIFLVMLLFYSKRHIRNVRACLALTGIVVVGIMGYQAYLNINTFSSFTYVLPVVVVTILLHSKPFDDKTGSLDISSFEGFIKQENKIGNSVDYLVLKLNLSMVDYLPAELGKVLNSFWHDSFKDALLFNLSSDVFILAVPRNQKNGNTEEKIKNLIEKYFYNYYAEYNLPYRVIGLFDVNFIDSVTDIAGIINYLHAEMEDNSILYVDDKKKDDLKLYKIIKETLSDIEKKNDLNDERVLVYCQPIRNMRNDRFDTAEALMRLNVPEVGMIMPGKFITLAENYNYIHSLSKIMLNKVCRKIKEFEQDGYDFKRISVNFTASEIKKDEFCDEILGIIKNNSVSPSKIGIELTESQTESDFVIVKDKIKILRDAGMVLYLDDVGTGYSNLDRIVQYDVDVVKFDRFFLLEAEKSFKVIKMMAHLSQAFRDLDYKLLFEGVESENHQMMCMNVGADYIQGFKYSKPVPIEELSNFLVKASEE